MSFQCSSAEFYTVTMSTAASEFDYFNNFFKMISWKTKNSKSKNSESLLLQKLKVISFVQFIYSY